MPSIPSTFKVKYVLSLIFLFFTVSFCAPSVKIVSDNVSIQVTSQSGQILSLFEPIPINLCCSMPQKYILNDTSHQDYQIITKNTQILSISGRYLQATSQIICKQSQCIAVVNNGCRQNKSQINFINVQLQNNTNFQYLVNCMPQTFYKPFEWGLFLLICFCTVAITASSLYSRAWSYKGFGVDIIKLHILFLNIFLIIFCILSFLFPSQMQILMKVLGSLFGTVGVMVCTSQGLWLIKSRKLNEQRIGKMRILDGVSLLIGLIVVGAYWATGGIWMINDVLAACLIVAAIKIFKIRSLKIGIILLTNLLMIELIVSLFIHYYLHKSYNNVVMQMFESPLVLLFPSITPELYRKCSWIPITNIVFPGLFVSYLRRFDKNRAGFLYLLIGYCSFYIGSILWMLLDINTQHSLPMAIISEPVMILTTLYFAHRRNQLKTLYNGIFYDHQVQSSRMVQRGAQEGAEEGKYVAFKQYTDGLKIIGRDSASSGGSGQWGNRKSYQEFSNKYIVDGKNNNLNGKINDQI